MDPSHPHFPILSEDEAAKHLVRVRWPFAPRWVGWAALALSVVSLVLLAWLSLPHG